MNLLMKIDFGNFVSIFGNSFALFAHQYPSVSVLVASLFLGVLLDSTDFDRTILCLFYNRYQISVYIIPFAMVLNN